MPGHGGGMATRKRRREPSKDAPPDLPSGSWFPKRRPQALRQLAFDAVEQQKTATYAVLKQTDLREPPCPHCKRPMQWFDMIGGEDRAAFEREARLRNGTDFFFSLYPYYCEPCRQGFGVGFAGDGSPALYSAYPFRGR